uniref:Uncharacterized protein LOC105126438 isoform X2 n=1 Tax=Rhizophora mucronata TaxID=61149 RepID=A0A2P2J7B3_RHIMU
MWRAVKLHTSQFNPAIYPDCNRMSCHYSLQTRSPHRRRCGLRSPIRPFASLTVRSHYDDASIATAAAAAPEPSSQYMASVGSPPSSHHRSMLLQLSQWNLTQPHVLALNLIAFVVAVSATWLFFSAIPALLAFKRAAESLEKLIDVTTEELPDTMAAIRLSGMEIGDLTMELSDLGLAWCNVISIFKLS